MAKLQYRSLSNRVVDRLSVEGKDVIYWDRDLPGFGVRVYRSGARVYLVQGRGPGGSKRIAVGRHGVISADEARRRGAMLLTRIKAGEELEPRSGTAAGPTVGELAERYLREHVAVRCKPNTARGYRRVIAEYILPTLGKLPAAALGREHVADLHHRLRMTPASANEAVGALSRIFNQAEAWGLVPAGGNPCRFVTKYRSRRLERFLTEEEFRRLGRVLDELEAEERLPVYAAAALRLLMLTGCRCSEIMTLRWEDVHLEVSEIRLRDSKTGPRVVPLSPAAARVLAGLPHAADNLWVIAGRKPGTRLSHIAYHWNGCIRRLLPRSTRPSPNLRRVGVHIFTFEACSGFTRVRPARSLNRPRRPLSQASVPPVTRQDRLSATRSNRQLSGWILPPLVLRAVGAH